MAFEIVTFTTRALGTIVILCIGFKLIELLLAFMRELRRLLFIRRHFPGPPPHWLRGNIADPGFNEPGFAWDRAAVDSYRRMLVLWVGWKPMIVLNHPDSIRELFSSTTGTIKAPMYQLFVEWFEGLGILEGDIWKRHRRLITPSFHFNILKSYATTMNRVTDTLLTKLSVLAESGEPLKVHDTMKQYASDVILQCAFSHQSNCQLERSRYVEVVDTLSETVVYRTFSPLMFYNFFFRLSSKYKNWKEGLRYAHALQERIVAERRKKYEEQGTEIEEMKMDFVDTLMTARAIDGKGLSDKEIRDEVSTFILAGVETSSSALTWLLLLLSKHPKHQERLEKEVDDVFAGRADDDVIYDDLHRLPFLTQCIKESLRVYVYVPVYRLLTAPLTVNGLTIPAGTEVVANNYQLHHNPDVWGEDHLEFNPSRFERDNVAKHDPFAFVPFAAGHRNCIGQNFATEELQIAIARIFRKFRVTLVKESAPIFRVVSKPSEEILLKLHFR